MEFLYTFWRSYPVLIDLMLYFFVFGAAARVSFAKVFPGHGGKALSVAVGLFLAAGLATAQREMGFSLERIGPIAVFILCGVLFIASYRFLQNAETPKPVTILICGLLALALLRAALPKASAEFARRNPLIVFLVIGGLAYWAWHSSEGFATRLFNRQPGQLLARHQAVPDRDTLGKEKQFIKKRLRNTTSADQKAEKAVRGDLEKALTKLEKERLTPESRGGVLDSLTRAQRRSAEIKRRTDKLFQLDEALRRFDLRWFKKMHGIDLSQLTPAQQDVVKKNLHEERKRIHGEEELVKLESKLRQHLADMEASVAKAREALMSWNAAGAIAWVNEALKVQSTLRALEDQALTWEKKLIHLVKHQQRQLDK
jgi:hypothetical protein